MNVQEIEKCERVHYLMQLSSYFSELRDCPDCGVNFAYTKLVSDTWYNQAYGIQGLEDERCSVEKILLTAEQYFKVRNREVCFYLTPTRDNEIFSKFLLKEGYSVVDEEAWMFFECKNGKINCNNMFLVKEVTKETFDIFEEVYRKTLPGPEVEQYILCVKNGLLSKPALVDIHYYVAYIGNVPVGMISLLSMNKYAGVYAVAVDEQYQRQGVCRCMLQKVVDVCKKSGIEYLFLQTGNGEPSQRAFLQMGFNTEFVRKGYVKSENAETIQHG